MYMYLKKHRLLKKQYLIALEVNYQYKIKHTILFFQELWFHKYMLASNFVNLMKKQILGLFLGQKYPLLIIIYTNCISKLEHFRFIDQFDTKSTKKRY